MNKLKHDQTDGGTASGMERKTKRKRKRTNNKWAAVAQRGCQVQSGVGRQDSQGAVTGGESWETCVSCLPRLQTTSLCFTGPFFPSTHRQYPPSPPSTLHHTKKKKNTTGATSIYVQSGALQTGEELVVGGEAAETNEGEMTEVKERERREY